MTASGKPDPRFDRIPPATAVAPVADETVVHTRDGDVQGKRALFSGAEQPPSVGSVALECPGCSRRSVVSYVRLARMMATGFYVPVVTSKAWVKCPACESHEWVTVSRS